MGPPGDEEPLEGPELHVLMINAPSVLAGFSNAS
ncbi:hCG2036844, isoform CRA_a [Homo sapiens]|nr:C21orf89 protein [Homo sapiens]EAX09355.1 hCG2036844, isoform CRA_a [Homo sapiens]